MGIRVNKFLGYGLTDVEHEDYEMKDQRLDLSVLDDLYERDRLDEYRAFIESRPKNRYDMPPAYLDYGWFLDRERPESQQSRRSSRRTLDDCFVWGAEYRLGSVFAVQPLSCSDWSRTDDPIDWVEETYRWESDAEPQINHVQTLPHGIYPWNSSYMDARDGRKLPDSVMPIIRSMSHAREMDYDLATELEDYRYLWEPMGFSTAQETVNLIAPVIPEEVQLLCEFVGIFTSPDIWLQLRPLVYVYWA